MGILARPRAAATQWGEEERTLPRPTTLGGEGTRAPAGGDQCCTLGSGKPADGHWGDGGAPPERRIPSGEGGSGTGRSAPVVIRVDDLEAALKSQ